MTDDTARPGPGPSRDPEPQRPGEGATDDATPEASQPEGAAVDTPARASDEGLRPETAGEPVSGAQVATGDTSTVEGQVPDDAAPSEPATAVAEPASGAEPVVEPEAGTESGDAAETAIEPDAIEAPVAAPTESPEVPAATPDAPDAAADATGETAAVAGVGAPAVESVPAGATDERRDAFTWHPEHKGKTFDEVRAALAQDIAADQRQHRLAMDGAEESEQEALASVVSLERKWGPYDFDWAEQEPDDLADRILAFERERERRRELISWSDYRNADLTVEESVAVGERAPELSTPAKGLSLLLVVLLIVVILLAVWAL